MPKSLEIGMLFVDVSEEGTILFELDSIPRDEEKFIIDNGAPMELYIVDEDDVFVEPHEIGWIDEGDHIDELRPISLEDVNYILNECNGWLELEIVGEFWDEEEQVIPNMYEQKVVIRLLTDNDDEE
jgi:hypothetical protein